jgi:hypothetical protein
VSRNLIRIWVKKLEAGAFDEDARAADLLQEYEAKIAALAVPPAYVDVLYAADPSAHIQAIGRDAAGRLQYRYHPDWQRMREMRKARRPARLAEVLPQIRRSIARHLGASDPRLHARGCHRSRRAQRHTSGQRAICAARAAQ